MPCSWCRVPSPLEMGFCVHTFGNAFPHERKSCLGGFLTFAYSRHHFHRREECQGEGGVSSLCKAQLSLQVIYFSLHDLLVILSLGYVTTHTGMASASLSGVYAPPPETFHSLRSGHAQGLGSYPVAGIWPARADGSLLYGGLILPCSIVVLTSTQVFPTDGANCRVRFWGLFIVKRISPNPTGPIQ